MTAKYWIGFLWLCFIVRGLFYCSTLPMWEGFDEFAHFAFIQRVFYYHDLPDPKTTGLTREVLESLKATPLVNVLNRKSTVVDYDAFWAGNPNPISRYPIEWGQIEAPEFVPSHELQQAPLYYWLLALIYWPIHGLDLVIRVWLLRSVSVLIGSFVVPFGFIVARRAFGNDRFAIAAVALFCSFPQLYIVIDHISNEALAIPLATGIIALLLRWHAEVPTRIRDAALAGLLFGAALLTKAYMLTMVPGAAYVFGSCMLRMKTARSTVVRQFAVAALTTALVAGWWYVRTYERSGSLSGEETDQAAHAMGGTADILRAAADMNWGYGMQLIAIHNIFLGNSSMILLSRSIYTAVYFLLLAAAIGVFAQLVRPRKDLPVPRDIALLFVICGAFAGALLYSELTALVALGNIQTLGCYFYATIAASAVLLVTGLVSLAPAFFELWTVAGVCLAGILIEVYAVMFRLLPYYAGLTHRLTTTAVERWRFSELSRASLWQLFERLSWNKPIGPVFLALLSSLWFACMLGVLAVPVLVAIGAKSHGGKRILGTDRR